MKKVLLILALFGMITIGALSPVSAQEPEEDLFEMEDTLSIDDMDPVFYEAEEDQGSSATTVVLIVVAVVVVGAGIYFVTKKKKK